MKPEVARALARMESPDSSQSAYARELDAKDMAVIREALESQDRVIIALIQTIMNQAARIEFQGVNIDAVHHSQSDREHVHFLGGSGHGSTIPI